MTREREIEILMMDGCTKREAENHLNRGALIFTNEDFDAYFDFYMEIWDLDEEGIQAFRRMIDEKIPVTDWGVVEDDEVYYISYVL